MTAKGELALRLTSTDQVSRVSDSSQTPIKVVPKGLRSYDEHDADFFLELLPGPRHADGLPESIHFWKARIEETDPDRTFRGGSDLRPERLRQVVPRQGRSLPPALESVLPVYVEATPMTPRSDCSKGCGGTSPTFPRSRLVDTLSALRGGDW